MALVRWTPRPALPRLSRWLDDEFERFFEGFPPTTGDVQSGRSWEPRSDVVENEHDITISVELPGVDQKDVKIEVRDNVLTLSGEKTAEHREEARGYYWTERTYGSFLRSFTLPSTVNAGTAKATHKNGVLAITLPKVEEAKPKQIPVESG